MMRKPTTKRPARTRTTRRGATLIDVATGSMLLAILLIPSVHMIGKSHSANQRLANREVMVYEAEQLLESLKVVLSETAAFDAAMGSPIDVTRTIIVPDGPDLTGRIRAAADTTMPTARLITAVADVWYDVDRNGRRGANELGETLRTQWATP